VRSVFMVLCVLAAMGPGRQVVRHFQARAAAKRITEFGPLPEWPITWVDWLLGGCSADSADRRHDGIRPPPSIGTVGSGRNDGSLDLFRSWLVVARPREEFFEPTPGHGTSIPWQQGLYQIGATAYAFALTYSRYWTRWSNGPFRANGKRRSRLSGISLRRTLHSAFQPIGPV
jgi:hypothetical protein